MTRSVVVTGLGLTSPVGGDVASSWDALVAWGARAPTHSSTSGPSSSRSGSPQRSRSSPGTSSTG